MNSVFEIPAAIIDRLIENGYEAYFVGGSVRDMLLGREIGDVDIATSAQPRAVMQLFNKTLPIGIEHGTVVVEQSGHFYEVTTFRTDGDYLDYRRPSEVKFVSSLKEDLQRRDFTINAIALTKDGQIIDPFSGRDDLQRRRICTVGNPSERFSEDALRMMRALRFSSQLDFKVEEETVKAITLHAEMLKHIAVERISVEFDKLLLGENRGQALRLLADTGLSESLPGLAGRKDVLHQMADSRLRELRELTEFWTVLFHFLDLSDPQSLFEIWKLPKKRRTNIRILLDAVHSASSKGWTDWQLYKFGGSYSQSAARITAALSGVAAQPALEEIARRYSSLPIHSRNELELDGRNLISWSGKRPGPWIEKALSSVEKAVVEQKLANDRADMKEWLEQCNLL
ncbi:CCA tRNA nucleotidyltransferase [Bacillus marinisedimentorum]|uniref:CCA tRNA nucleotidyltransferase n=1 Tax=Bacillus marinisedimentorum TaxID=1821260 RepID=UPI000872D15A|nr:CCA tRNA nucleotidyltransferase [Bacillus marinisedimentorum]